MSEATRIIYRKDDPQMQTMTLKRIKNYFNLFMLSSASVLDCEKISLVFLMNNFDEGVGKLA